MHYNMNASIRKYLSFIFLFLLLNSCGMWNNFTVYFNRFYIAQTAFEEGEEEIELNQEKPLFQFKEERLSSKANQQFDTVIKFSSKILQFNKESKYVNEAIYMIAKSYYYKGQYNKALRKFTELDGLNNRDFELLAKLWIAKSELQMRKFTVALEHLSKVKSLATKEKNTDVFFQASVAEISYLIYREEFSKAVDKIEGLIKQDLDDEVKSEVTYELGMLYISLEDYEKAVVAFERVEEGDPNFEIEFKSKFEYAKAIKHLGREEEALELLNELRDDTKYEEHWDIIDLEIAQAELESGEIETAMEIFYSIDTGYTKNETSGIAAFMQGDVLEHIYMDYDSAKFLYDKVASKKAPKEYKVEAREKSKMLESRNKLSRKIFTSLKEYEYLLDTLLFKKDSLAYAGYLTRRDSVMRLEKGVGDESAKSTRGAGRPSRGTTKAIRDQFKYEEDSLFTYEPKLPIISVDSMRNQIAFTEYELGNLYFSDLLVPDSAYHYYKDVINNYSDTKYNAKTLYALGSYYLTKDKKEKADSLFKFVYDNFKSDPVAKIAAVRLGIKTDELNSDPALDKYYVAENLIENKKFFDAIEELDSLYKAFPESEYSPKALYTIGWIYENELSDYDGAVEYYDTLKTKYPKTEYARTIKPRLNFYHQKEKAYQDSVARVQKAITDSLRADSLAQIKADSLLSLPVSISDSTATLDSVTFVDSSGTTIVDSTKDGLEIIKEKVLEKDSTAKKMEDVKGKVGKLPLEK